MPSRKSNVREQWKVILSARAAAPGEREARGEAMVGAQANVRVRGGAVGNFSLLPSRARGTR